MRFSRLTTGFGHKLHKVKWQVNRALRICKNSNGTMNWHKQHSNGPINASSSTIQQEILVRLLVFHQIFLAIVSTIGFYLHTHVHFQIDSLWAKIWQSSGVQLRYRITSHSHHVSKTGSMKFRNTLGDPDGQPKQAITRNWCGAIPIWLDVATHTTKTEDVSTNFGCATMDQGEFSFSIENNSLRIGQKYSYFAFSSIFFSL